MEADDIVYVDSRKVACDGTGPALGHPRVFLNMGTENEIVCPYCSRRFILAEPSAEMSGAQI